MKTRKRSAISLIKDKNVSLRDFQNAALTDESSLKGLTHELMDMLWTYSNEIPCVHE